MEIKLCCIRCGFTDLGHIVKPQDNYKIDGACDQFEVEPTKENVNENKDSCYIAEDLVRKDITEAREYLNAFLYSIQK